MEKKSVLSFVQSWLWSLWSESLPPCAMVPDYKEEDSLNLKNDPQEWKALHEWMHMLCHEVLSIICKK